MLRPFKDDEGIIVDLDNNRMTELLNICEETDGKVIVGPTGFTIL